jgi:hypothetical protein
MGLLDDAIREHLELKRKHGADPEDVARQENEALGRGGPRAEFAQPDADLEPQVSEFAQPDVDPEPQVSEISEPPAAAEPGPAPQDELPPGEPGIPEEPSEGHTAEAPGYDEDPWLDEEPDEVPAGDALERRDPQHPPTADEDVLEETPDFLQETPEHERLWFEQKPPRDFDWDK